MTKSSAARLIESIVRGADPRIAVKRIGENYKSGDVKYAVYLITSRLKPNVDKEFNGDQVEKLLLGANTEMKAILKSDESDDFWLEVQHELRQKGFDVAV